MKTLEIMREQITPWEAWILNNDTLKSVGMSYDTLMESVVSIFSLRFGRRDEEKTDKVHFFLIWWKKNKRFSRKYKTNASVGALLGIDHATVIYYAGKKGEEGRRVKSYNFDDNVEQIKDYLES